MQWFGLLEMSSGILVSGDGLMFFWNPFLMVYCLHWLVMGCHQIVVAFSFITIFLSYPQLDIVEDSTRFCQCKNGLNEELEWAQNMVAWLHLDSFWYCMPLEDGVVFGFSLKGGSVMAYVLLMSGNFWDLIKIMIRYMFRYLGNQSKKVYIFFFLRVQKLGFIGRIGRPC